MKPDIFLKSDTARELYESTAKDLPIIDYHNHLSVSEIKNDRSFENLTELWLAPDPYKHRLMRICGVEEALITGDADPYEKFEAFCRVFPYLAGNPVYSWARMELAEIFGIHELPSQENARILYDQTREMLSSPDYSYRAILNRFSVEYLSPVASLTDDLSLFDGKYVAPSLRGDDLLTPNGASIREIEERTNKKITDTESYIDAVAVLLDAFADRGCRFADHALDHAFFEKDKDGRTSDLLCRLAAEYKKRDWTLLLHLDAKRQTSTRLASIAGRAGGYACAGGSFPLATLTDMLDRMEQNDGLPDTLLFTLNASDIAPLAILQGSFSEDGTKSKVGLGPAWWWCDHALEIRTTLSAVSSYGVLSEFIGMTTDSRSVLSFSRHGYFRRLLCSWIAEQNEKEEWELPLPILKEIVYRLCYGNAKNKLTRKSFK